MLKTQNWILPTCDSFPLIVSQIDIVQYQQGGKFDFCFYQCDSNSPSPRSGGTARADSCGGVPNILAMVETPPLLPVCCILRPGGGGGQHSTFFFFWWVCATQVSKSRVLGADFPWKMRGLENENFEILRFESWKFGQNKAENADFFLKIENGEHMSGALMVNW